ncbi:glyoxalase [Cohnella luojiensis]|uniref:Glyoxalase n=2 Tax=Cohnella luojiensis TaxID=652876 RepID=A0A4Y8M7H3_9BACL|nr:VOC family protein [Cohnella luojiensis]TFE29529.1 glyoxalase [Cohnella luojiensis]
MNGMEWERVHHVSLAVRDLERAREFYSGVLRLTEIQRPPFGSRGIWFQAGGQQLHLIEHPGGQALREGGIDTSDGHFAVWVKSYREAIDFLEQAGIAHKASPDSIAGFSQIYIQDPDGNIIELDAAYGS